jgi:2'-5' RNA ligase
MKQAIVLLLKKDSKLERVRGKYNKESHKYKPHITLVYPFEVESQHELKKHIQKSLENFKPINLRLKGLKKSKKGYYLYLLIDKGKEEIIQIYKKLNSGLLKDFKNKDMPTYIPHLSLGVFKNKKEIDNAIKEVSKLNLSFNYKINSIQLLNLNKDHSLGKVTNFKL